MRRAAITISSRLKRDSFNFGWIQGQMGYRILVAALIYN